VSEPSLLPIRFFRLFLETLNAELGSDTLSVVLEKGNLPPDLIDPQAASRFTSASAAETYARIQQALRVYYGRGARGTLVRIGRILWGRLLDKASFGEKAQAQIVRSLPAAMRLKPTLELLAGFLREKKDGASVHTLDMDLMLADHAGASTIGQKEATSICSVTLGLIEEALFWASGREYDMLEVSCRASGGSACEFKITVSGQ
jgi:predicted hydrocarbon binding protein